MATTEVAASRRLASDRPGLALTSQKAERKLPQCGLTIPRRRVAVSVVRDVLSLFLNPLVLILRNRPPNDSTAGSANAPYALRADSSESIDMQRSSNPFSWRLLFKIAQFLFIYLTPFLLFESMLS